MNRRAELLRMPAVELAALYTYNVVWSWQEQCYVATVEGWDTLMADAPTVKDALKDVTRLVQITIESLRAEGLSFPLPAGSDAPRVSPAPGVTATA